MMKYSAWYPSCTQEGFFIHSWSICGFGAQPWAAPQSTFPETAGVSYTSFIFRRGSEGRISDLHFLTSLSSGQSWYSLQLVSR